MLDQDKGMHARHMVKLLRSGLRSSLSLLLVASAMALHAAPPASAGAALAADEPTASLSVAQWIERMRQASQQRSYTGTFVVLSSSGAMASSRIWHACDGRQQIERVDALSGTPRTVFRRDDEVRTFLPQSRVVRMERRDAPGRFPPAVLHIDGLELARYYVARPQGQERVAGLMADVVWFQPQDGLRFGYRIWSERASGLAVKLQTVGPDGRVLEQAAFSQLDLETPVPIPPLSQAMDNLAGYHVVPVALEPTTAAAEGWVLREPVPGFVPVNCYRRPAGHAKAGAEAEGMLQCVYSDGLASVSLFLERFDASRHPPVVQEMALGATHTLGQRIAQDTWFTAVGEVPAQTLKQFARQLQRTR